MVPVKKLSWSMVSEPPLIASVAVPPLSDQISSVVL
jgi:hypothetical protein